MVHRRPVDNKTPLNLVTNNAKMMPFLNPATDASPLLKHNEAIATHLSCPLIAAQSLPTNMAAIKPQFFAAVFPPSPSSPVAPPPLEPAHQAVAQNTAGPSAAWESEAVDCIVQQHVTIVRYDVQLLRRLAFIEADFNALSHTVEVAVQNRDALGASLHKLPTDRPAFHDGHATLENFDLLLDLIQTQHPTLPLPYVTPSDGIIRCNLVTGSCATRSEANGLPHDVDINGADHVETPLSTSDDDSDVEDCADEYCASNQIRRRRDTPQTFLRREHARVTHGRIRPIRIRIVGHPLRENNCQEYYSRATLERDVPCLQTSCQWRTRKPSSPTDFADHSGCASSSDHQENTSADGSYDETDNAGPLGSRVLTVLNVQNRVVPLGMCRSRPSPSPTPSIPLPEVVPDSNLWFPNTPLTTLKSKMPLSTVTRPSPPQSSMFYAIVNSPLISHRPWSHCPLPYSKSPPPPTTEAPSPLDRPPTRPPPWPPPTYGARFRASHTLRC